MRTWVERPGSIVVASAGCEMTTWVERWAAAGAASSETRVRMVPIRPRMVPSFIYVLGPGPGLSPRIEGIAQRIADQVDAEHHDHDGQPRKYGRPPRLPYVRRGVPQIGAP